MSTRACVSCFLIALFIADGVAVADDDLAPSRLTGVQVEPLLRAGITTDELHRSLQTTPALINANTFHWRLRDGSLWTGFQRLPDGGLWIVMWQLETESANAAGGEMMELGRRFTFYYLKPEPERIADLIESASRLQVLDAPDMRRPTVSFLAQIFRQNPERAQGWLDAVQPLPREHRRVVYEALWRSDTGTARKLLAHYDPGQNPEDRTFLLELTEREPLDLLAEPIDSAARLDELWGAFFATGQREFIERLCSTFEWDVAGRSDDDERKIIFGAAIWSVKSNIQQHDAVRAICLDLARREDSATADVLKEMLANLDP